MPTHSRPDAWNLLTEFTQSESLRKHALAVEACRVPHTFALFADVWESTTTM
ncbi:MAG TPA: hypothetical protein VF753_13730 [Terriglobales bacterium]